MSINEYYKKLVVVFVCVVTCFTLSVNAMQSSLDGRDGKNLSGTTDDGDLDLSYENSSLASNPSFVSKPVELPVQVIVEQLIKYCGFYNRMSALLSVRECLIGEYIRACPKDFLFEIEGYEEPNLWSMQSLLEQVIVSGITSQQFELLRDSILLDRNSSGRPLISCSSLNKDIKDFICHYKFPTST